MLKQTQVQPVGQNNPYITMGSVNTAITIVYVNEGNNKTTLPAQNQAQTIAATPKKQQIIDNNLNKLTQAAQAITKLIDFIQANRHKDPSQVDGQQLIALEEQIYQTCESLLNQIDLPEFESLIQALTGQGAWPLIIKQTLQTGPVDHHTLQKEINSIAPKNPIIASQLQLLLDEQTHNKQPTPA